MGVASPMLNENKINMSKKTKEKKVYVLDTNVPLHDPKCCEKFQEHDIIIPIHVLAEIDRFKKGADTINVNARGFSRFLDGISSNKIFNGGVSLGKGLGNIQIALGVDYPKDFEKSFMEDTVDHRILCIAFDRKNRGEHIVLVSKDINMRTKARALGILAEDYRNDAVKDVAILENPIIEISKQEVETLKNLKENQLFNCHEGLFRWRQGKLRPVISKKCSHIEAKNMEQKFALNALMDKEISLIAITGIAGSGKTLLSIAAGLEQTKEFESILVARPIVQLSGKDVMGFLPGDAKDKMGPYMAPIYDNIGVIKNCSLKKYRKSDLKKAEISDKLEEWMKEKKIEVEPLAYIRGRSITHTFFIIDEAQNLTPHEVKTIITRAGEGTKIVLTGDLSQIDSPYLDEKSSGLSYLVDAFSGQPEFVHVNLKEGERSPLAEKAGKLL